MKTRYVVKSVKEPKRGEQGTITMYYGYDSETRAKVTATSPLKSDVQRLLESIKKLEGKDE